MTDYWLPLELLSEHYVIPFVKQDITWLYHFMMSMRDYGSSSPSGYIYPRGPFEYPNGLIVNVASSDFAFYYVNKYMYAHSLRTFMHPEYNLQINLVYNPVLGERCKIKINCFFPFEILYDQRHIITRSGGRPTLCSTLCRSVFNHQVSEIRFGFDSKTILPVRGYGCIYGMPLFSPIRTGSNWDRRAWYNIPDKYQHTLVWSICDSSEEYCKLSYFVKSRIDHYYPDGLDKNDKLRPCLDILNYGTAYLYVERTDCHIKYVYRHGSNPLLTVRITRDNETFDLDVSPAALKDSELLCVSIAGLYVGSQESMARYAAIRNRGEIVICYSSIYSAQGLNHGARFSAVNGHPSLSGIHRTTMGHTMLSTLTGIGWNFGLCLPRM